MLMTAAVLTILISLAHSYLGERYILIRLFRREGLPKLLGGTEFTRQTLRFAWHVTSVAWVGFGLLLAQLASFSPAERAQSAVLIGGTFATTGVVALLGSRGRHLSWLVFFAIALLAWLGVR